MAEVITRFRVESEQYEKKVKQAGKSLDDLKSKSKGAGSALQDLSGKMGINVSALTKLSVATAAVAGACKLAVEAFRSTESGIDSWGRSTRSAETTYQSFLQALNHGDIGMFLSNIETIKNAAIEAYNALDNLGTMTAFSDVDLQRIQTQRLKLQLDIKRGQQNGEDVKALQDELMGKDQEIVAIAQEKAQLAGEAYEATLKEAVSGKGGVTWDSAIAHKYADSWEGFSQVSDDLIKQKQKELDEFMKANDLTGTSMSYYKQHKNAGTPFLYDTSIQEQALQMEHELKIIQAIKDNEASVVEAKKNQVIAEQAIQQALQAQMNSTRYLKDKTTTGATSTSTAVSADSDIRGIKAANLARIQSYKDDRQNEQQVDAMFAAMQTPMGNLGEAFQDGSIKALNAELAEATSLMQSLTIGTEDYAAAMQWVSEVQGKLNLSKPAEASGSSWKEAASAIGSVGSALSMLEDPALKITGIVAEAIANVALAAGHAMAAKDTTASGWAWIGAAGAITGVMISTISAIKQATEYHAQGGVVGNGFVPHGTDTVPAMLTPGEIVLNRAQQSNIANSLSSNSMADFHLETDIRAERLRIMLKNNKSRRGRAQAI